MGEPENIDGIAKFVELCLEQWDTIVDNVGIEVLDENMHMLNKHVFERIRKNAKGVCVVIKPHHGLGQKYALWTDGSAYYLQREMADIPHESVTLKPVYDRAMKQLLGWENEDLLGFVQSWTEKRMTDMLGE